MASKSPLRAVKPGETPEPRKPLTLIEAVELGDYLEILRAQRRDIADSLPDEKGPAKAALHRQLSVIAKEIETLEAREQQEGAKNGAVPDEAFDAQAI
jgi:hypothetical protein